VAGPAGSNDPASATTGPGQDFLSALADAGQAGGKGDALLATGGAPQAPSPSISGVSPAMPAPASGATSAAQAASATAQSATPTQTDPAIPIGQVPMTIGLRSLNGSNAFQIRLDPVELGRIEVKLEIDKARGAVTTHLVVDRPETLAMLQRDVGQLQQALTQAGLDPSAGGGLNLSLRSDGGAQTGGGSGQQGGSFQGGAAGWTRDQAEVAQEAAPTRWLRGYGGLDIRI
jgi:flagellar hook-length control protein FliK